MRRVCSYPINSVVQFLRCLGQLFFGTLRVPRCRIQRLVAENLCQPHEVVAVVHKELVGHRVPQQVRMDFHPCDCTVLVAQRPHSTVCQRPSFPNEDLGAIHRWTGIEVRLEQEAQRTNADVEGVEIKGTCPVFEFEERRIVKIKAGTNAKLPRGDIRATTHLDITELAKFVPVEEKVPVVRKSPYVSSSASWRPHAITPEDLAGLASLRKLAARLGTPSEKCSGRVAVTVEDVAVFLLLLRFFRGNMNENGTLPYARFEGLWTALFRAGDIDRAFNPKRFAAIRNHLSSLLVDGEALLEWEDETFTLGRACKWRASEKLMELIEQEQEKEETSTAETRPTVVVNYPRPRASWEAQREEKAQIIALIGSVRSLYDKKRRLAA